MDIEKLENARNFKLAMMKVGVILLFIIFVFFSYRVFVFDKKAIPSWFALVFLVMPILSSLFIFFYKRWKTYFGGIMPTFFCCFWIVLFHLLTTTMNISINFLICMFSSLAIPLFILYSLKHIAVYLKRNLYGSRLNCSFLPNLKKYEKVVSENLDQQGLLSSEKVYVDNAFVGIKEDVPYLFVEYSALFADRMDLVANDTTSFYGILMSAELKDDIDDSNIYIDANIKEFKEAIANLKMPFAEEINQNIVIYSDKENNLLTGEIKEQLAAYANNNKYVVVIKDRKLYCWFAVKQNLFEVSVSRPVQSTVDNFATISEHIIENDSNLVAIFKDLVKAK